MKARSSGLASMIGLALSISCGSPTTDTSSDRCASCASTECNDVVSECYGEGWRKSEFGGVCGAANESAACSACRAPMNDCIDTRCTYVCDGAGVTGLPGVVIGGPVFDSGPSTRGPGGGGATTGVGGYDGFGGKSFGGGGALGPCRPTRMPCTEGAECCSGVCDIGLCD